MADHWFATLVVSASERNATLSLKLDEIVHLLTTHSAVLTQHLEYY